MVPVPPALGSREGELSEFLLLHRHCTHIVTGTGRQTAEKPPVTADADVSGLELV